MEVGSSSSGPSVPAIRNKTMKTLTMCARAHKMFPDIAALSGRPDLRLLVLGPAGNKLRKLFRSFLGPGNEKGFVPEFLELSALLWSSPAEFTLVDHNADVITAIKENKVYYMPTQKQLGIGATGEERMRALDPIVSLGHVLDQDKPNELHLPLPNEVHALKFFEGDFTAFEYATDVRCISLFGK